MKNEQNAPKIRFKGFTDAWEQRKLDELVKFYSGLTYKPEDVTENGTLVLRSSNVKNSEIVLTDNVYVDESVVNSDNVKKDDIIVVVRNGSKALIGKHAKIRHSMPNTVIGAFMTGLRSDSPDFINALLSTEMFDKEIKMNMGATINQITGYMFANMEFMTPSFQERQAVGSFFSRLDDLITLHQRKCETLQKLKKSMLQKMFPKNGSCFPEIRFAGFTDAWELRELGDIVGIYDGVHQTPNYQNSGIMFLSVENIATLKSSKFISEEDFKRDYKVYPQENDILMTRIGDVGTTNVVTDNGLKAYYVSLALLKYKGTDPYFLSNAIQSDYVQKGLANRTLKTAIPMKINKDEIGKVSVMLPLSATEQQQIGTYFRTLDHLITLHQRKPFQHIMEVINIAKRY